MSIDVGGEFSMNKKATAMPSLTRFFDGLLQRGKRVYWEDST